MSLCMLIERGFSSGALPLIYQHWIPFGIFFHQHCEADLLPLHISIVNFHFYPERSCLGWWARSVLPADMEFIYLYINTCVLHSSSANRRYLESPLANIQELTIISCLLFPLFHPGVYIKVLPIPQQALQQALLRGFVNCIEEIQLDFVNQLSLVYVLTESLKEHRGFLFLSQKLFGLFPHKLINVIFSCVMIFFYIISSTNLLGIQICVFPLEEFY